MFRFLTIPSLAFAATLGASAIAAAAAPTFEIKDDPKAKTLDVLQSGKVIGRYMYDYDNSSGKRRNETFKTYLHLFNPAGDLPITKGVPGDFDHHRGIFIGWNKITIDDLTFDCWHGHGAAQIHQEFTNVKADARGATFTSRLLWEKAKNGPPAIEENRTMTFQPAPAPAYGMVDVTSKLKVLDGKTAILDGDPEHAGLQFRAAQEIDRTKTLYLYPKEKPDVHKDLDYPWLGGSFALNGKTYSVIYFNNQDNPKNALYSCYRDYCRFGAFFKTSIEKDKELTIKVRFLLIEGPFPPAKWIQQQYNLYTGGNSPTPSTKEMGPS